jgi:hypothetical protein
MTDLTDATWRKSSYSGSNGGQCVEVARNLPGIVAVRDSKQYGTGPVLEFTPAQWRGLLGSLRTGGFPAEG